MSARKDFATLVVTFMLNGGLNHITLCLFILRLYVCHVALVTTFFVRLPHREALSLQILHCCGGGGGGDWILHGYRVEFGLRNGL